MAFGSYDDDFQFKPLTEGLGFHKKTMELKEELLNSMPVQTGILPKSKNVPLTQVPQSHGNRQLASPSIQNPLPQKPMQKPVAQVQQPAPWKGALSNQDFIEKPAPIKLVEVSSNWPASFFDMAMVAGITLLFTAVVFALIQVDLAVLFESLQTDFGLQSSTFAVVIAVLEIYTVATRTFFGKTLGEWVFDSRLGTPEQQATFTYPFKVAWRTFVIAFTGFVTLPALSSLIGEDLAGMLSGVKLYAEKR